MGCAEDEGELVVVFEMDGGSDMLGIMSFEKSSTSSNRKLMFPLFVTTTVWVVNSMIEDVNNGSTNTSLELVDCVIGVWLPPSMDMLTTTFPGTAPGIVANRINA